MPHFDAAILDGDPAGALVLREILGLAPPAGEAGRGLGKPRPDARASGGTGPGRSRKNLPGPTRRGAAGAASGRSPAHPCRRA
ncbi:hypothetical protein [Methylobacterium oryzihabitans]|uniref:Uncharacterized protein n=1 Tax=Methylobacterium oryzihabitans TaxID=2499852 RepID=A0A3S2V2N6_9HYPH|nr:hypothetical protein [Methylobacterium oryzihabitans]RVU13848.1 hypothetical protein EOE48_25735 [Methylobacterium oryzihabitans]